MSIKMKKAILIHGNFNKKFFDGLSTKTPETVFVLEGRPSLKSSEHACKELLKRKIKPTLICDNMAGFLFYKKLLTEVWLSCQTTNSQGALCSIGGLILGVLGKRHQIPVYLLATSTTTKYIGDAKEVLQFKGMRVAPKNVKGYVPLVDWLPRKYITKKFT